MFLSLNTGCKSLAFGSFDRISSDHKHAQYIMLDAYNLYRSSTCQSQKARPLATPAAPVAIQEGARKNQSPHTWQSPGIAVCCEAFNVMSHTQFFSLLRPFWWFIGFYGVFQVSKFGVFKGQLLQPRVKGPAFQSDPY